MASTSQTLWQRLSDQPRWIYVIIWAICTALGWGTYRHLTRMWFMELLNLGVLGILLELVLAVFCVGLVQSILLNLYLKKYPFYVWLIVCIGWFGFMSQIASAFFINSDLSPISLLDEIQFFGGLFTFCTVSILSFRRYTDKWQRWNIAVIPIVLFFIFANLSENNLVANSFFLDFMDLFGIYHTQHPLKFYAIGLNIGLVTSLVFVVTPKNKDPIKKH